MAETWTAIGRVRSVNPSAREVRVNVRDPYAYVFDALPWVRFQRSPDDALRCKVVAVKMDGDVPVLTLSPGVSRDVVGTLKGLPVVLAPDEVPPRPVVASRLADWIGLRVILPSGEILGTVSEIFEGPANDAFAVQRPVGGPCILPAIDALVEAVDLARGTIRVRDVGPFIVEP